MRWPQLTPAPVLRSPCPCFRPLPCFPSGSCVPAWPGLRRPFKDVLQVGAGTWECTMRCAGCAQTVPTSDPPACSSALPVSGREHGRMASAVTPTFPVCEPGSGSLRLWGCPSTPAAGRHPACFVSAGGCLPKSGWIQSPSLRPDRVLWRTVGHWPLLL